MVLQQIEALTPQWLTEKLRAKAALERGAVSHIAFDPDTFHQGMTADVVRLSVSYSDGATGSQPNKLIIKLPKPGLHAELLNRGAHEVKFYQAIEAAGLDLPVPSCYDAAFEEHSHRSHLLLQDLSDTHFQRPLPIPPSNQHCRAIMESCAQVHAAWWNSPRLGTDMGERLTPEKAGLVERRLIDTIPAFFDYLGDALLPFQRKTLEQIVSAGFLAGLSQRLCDLRQVTLIHGDVHNGNLLFPHQADARRVLLIDWQLWDIHLATIDLAFWMALHWNPQRRAVLEQPLLQHYYQHLLANGVSGYRYDDLWRDYRQAVIVMCLIPIGQFRRNSPAGVVWFGLQDSLSAYQDLHCEDVLVAPGG